MSNASQFNSVRASLDAIAAKVNKDHASRKRHNYVKSLCNSIDEGRYIERPCRKEPILVKRLDYNSIMANSNHLQAANLKLTLPKIGGMSSCRNDNNKFDTRPNIFTMNESST